MLRVYLQTGNYQSLVLPTVRRGTYGVGGGGAPAGAVDTCTAERDARATAAGAS